MANVVAYGGERVNGYINMYMYKRDSPKLCNIFCWDKKRSMKMLSVSLKKKCQFPIIFSATAKRKIFDVSGTYSMFSGPHPMHFDHSDILRSFPSFNSIKYLKIDRSVYYSIHIVTQRKHMRRRH